MKKLLISLGLLFGVCFCIRAQPISGTSGAGWSPVISNRVYTMIITYGGSIGTTNSVSISSNGVLVASVPTNLTFWPVGVGGSIMFVTNVNNEVHVTVRALAPEFTNNSYINNLNVGGDTKAINIYSRSNFTDRVVISNALQVLFTANNGFLWVDGNGTVSDKAVGNNGEFPYIAAGDLSWTAPLWAPSNTATPLKIYGANDATVSSNAGIYTVSVTASGTGSTNQNSSGFDDTFAGNVSVSSNIVAVSIYATNINANTLNLLRLIVNAFQVTNAQLQGKVLTIGSNSNLTQLLDAPLNSLIVTNAITNSTLESSQLIYADANGKLTSSDLGYINANMLDSSIPLLVNFAKMTITNMVAGANVTLTTNSGVLTITANAGVGTGSTNMSDSGFTVVLNGDLQSSNKITSTNIYSGFINGGAVQINGINAAPTNNPYITWPGSGAEKITLFRPSAGQVHLAYTDSGSATKTNFWIDSNGSHIGNTLLIDTITDNSGGPLKLLVQDTDNNIMKTETIGSIGTYMAPATGGYGWSNLNTSITNAIAANDLLIFKSFNASNGTLGQVTISNVVWPNTNYFPGHVTIESNAVVNGTLTANTIQGTGSGAGTITVNGAVNSLTNHTAVVDSTNSISLGGTNLLTLAQAISDNSSNSLYTVSSNIAQAKADTAMTTGTNYTRSYAQPVQLATSSIGAATMAIDMTSDQTICITNGFATSTFWLTNIVDRKWFVLRCGVTNGASTITITNAAACTMNVINTNGFSVTTLPQMPVAANKIATIIGRAWVIAGTTNVDLYGNVQQ